MRNLAPVPPHQRPPLPAFTPVPRKYRYDGWTPDRQRAFIDALAETGSVKHAAHSINMSTHGAYHLRRQPGAEEFRAAWDAALDFGVQTLIDIAIERAREGVAVPVFYQGEQVGERRWYNDRLLMFILKHHMPSRYGANLHPGTRHDTVIDNDPDGEQALEEVERRLKMLRQHLDRETMASELATRQAVRQAFYDRYAHDPVKRAAWETLHERPIESLLEASATPTPADLAQTDPKRWPLLQDWRSAPDEDD